MTRARLLSGTALIGIMTLALFPGPALAACDINVPSAGQTVTCMGTDTVGVSGGANNVRVNIDAGNSISTTGVNAIQLGTSSVIDLKNGTSSIVSNVTAININGGTVYANGTINGGSGTAIDFGTANANLSIYNGTNITGTVLAGSAMDTFILDGGTNSSLNVSDIGTKYIGFDVFQKKGASTWALSGTGNQSWDVQAGTLQGDTTSMSGNLAVSSGANVTFNQAAYGSSNSVISGAGSLTVSGATLNLNGNNTYTGGTTITSGANLQGTTSSLTGNIANGSNLTFTQSINGTYSGIISGAGRLNKYGTGTVTLTGANTYTGTTFLYAGALSVSADNNLGTGALTLNGGTLRSGAAYSNSHNISLGTNNGTIDTNGFNTTASGVISGTGSLTKTGTGTLTLSGANSFSGGLIISAGQIAATPGTLGVGNVVNSGTLFLNTGSNGTYSGIISGTGNLVKQLAGTVTLTGASTYTGSTSILGGALNISADNNIGATSSNLTLNGGTLQSGAAYTNTHAISLGASNGTIDTNGFATTISGIISGTGSLTKTGTGNLVLSGTNSYSGATTVSTGRLSVNGTITGTTTVASAGTLGGNGNFGAIVANGRIAPGNSIGTMNVTGPVTFNSGSVYEVEVNAAGNSDKLIATGALTINGGTVDVKAASGTYADTTVYNNILQGSSRSGTFSGVTTDLMFLTPTLSYDATSVDLSLARNDVDFNAVAQDDVQAGVANAVQGLGSGNDLYTAFSGLNIQEASIALDTLSGEHNAGITTATAQSASTIQKFISARVQNLGSKNIASIAPAAGDDTDVEIKKNFWSEIFGYRGKSDAQGTAPAQNRESSGALFGADAEISSDVFAGIFGGYEIGEIYTDTQNANSDVNSWHAGIYASKNFTPSWRISTNLIGSYHDIDTTRHISFTGFSETPKGETSGYTISPSIETGYAFTASGMDLEPFIGLSLTHSYISSYSEKDGGSANLDVDSVSQTNMSHMLGLRLTKELPVTDETTVNISAHAGWNHVYGDLDVVQTMQFSAGATSFDVKGAGRARNSAVFGIGADIPLGFNEANAYVNYNGEVSGENDNQGVTLGVRVPF